MKTTIQSRTVATGFTLIEVMIVVVILGILAAVVVPRIMGNPDEARITVARTDINNITSALSMYRLDAFSYPSTDQGLEALLQRPANLPSGARWREGGYLSQMPKDPWGNPYQYLQPGVKGEFDLWSLGADGAPGGEGLGADIGNWPAE